MGDQEPSKLSRIQDIPKIKSLVEQVRVFKIFKSAFPFLKPVLKILGVSTEEIEVALLEVDELEKKVALLSTLPDHFNRLFASRGWIAYDVFNVDVAQAALEKAEAGDIDGAETVLVEYYDEERLRWHVQTMQAVEKFRPRFSLIEKALDDYLAGRYHASVPVVLMQLDGFVNDLGNHGFFSEGVELEAWDSIAAHSTGLKELAKVLGKTRRKTSTERLTLPYRHGILHGLDLGYDTKMVAAKSWAALFAVREWAYKVEQKEVKAPPAQPPTTLRDTSHTLQDAVKVHSQNTKVHSQIEAWHPRSLQIGVDIPVSGGPEAYEQGGPEQKLVEYLSYWQKGKYGNMAQSLAVTALSLHTSVNALAGDLRDYYKENILKAFVLLDVHDSAPSATVIKVQLFCEQYGEEKERTIEYRLHFESETRKAIVRGDPEGHWGVFSPYYI